MDIKDKLYQLTGDSRNKAAAADKEEESSAYSDSKSGKNEEDFQQDGAHHIEREVLGPQYKHGKYSLQQISERLFPQACFLLNRDRGVNREEVLFLDTETTGLAGGTGTCAFMVGMGYFSESELILEQHLMRDFDEEHSLLTAIKNRLESRPVPVTFNGKTFDIPLLKNRFILQRLNFPDCKTHLDLLHPSRRMWKHLSSCSLNNLERNLLNFYRKNDIDGSEVPRYYRAYLENKNWQLLKPIFKHNKYDIISLAMLSFHLDRVACPEGDYNHTPQEYYNLGRQLEKLNCRQQSIYCYEKALESSDRRRLQQRVEEKLTWQYKRENVYEPAVNIWNAMIESGRGGLFPYIELAKFYEHQQKSYQPALKICRRAEAYLHEKRTIIEKWREKKDKLQHRIERLESKL